MSGKNFFAIERRVRKRELLAIISENPKIQDRRLKGIFSLKNGLTFKRIECYLRELVDASLIEIDADGLVTVVGYDDSSAAPV